MFFEIVNQYQDDKLMEFGPQLVALAKMRNENDIANEISELFLVRKIDRFERPQPDYIKTLIP